MATEQELQQAEEEAQRVLAERPRERRFGAGENIIELNRQLSIRQQQARTNLEIIRQAQQQQAEEQRQRQQAELVANEFERGRRGRPPRFGLARKNPEAYASFKAGQAERRGRDISESAAFFSKENQGKTFRYSTPELREKGIEVVVSATSGKPVGIRDIQGARSIPIEVINKQIDKDKFDSRLGVIKDRQQSLLTPVSRIEYDSISSREDNLLRSSRLRDNKNLQVVLQKNPATAQVAEFTLGFIKEAEQTAIFGKALVTKPKSTAISTVVNTAEYLKENTPKQFLKQQAEQFKSKPAESLGSLAFGFVLSKALTAPIKFLNAPEIVKIDKIKVPDITSEASIVTLRRGEQVSNVAQFTVKATTPERFAFVVPRYELFIKRFAGIGKPIPDLDLTYDELLLRYSQGKKILIQPQRATGVITEPFIVQEGRITRALKGQRSPIFISQSGGLKKSSQRIGRIGGEVERITFDYDILKFDQLKGIDKGILKQLENTYSKDFLKEGQLDIATITVKQGLRKGTKIQTGTVVTEDVFKLLSSGELISIPKGKRLTRGRLVFSNKLLSEVEFPNEFGLTSSSLYEDIIGGVDITKPRFRTGKATKIKGFTRVNEINLPELPESFGVIDKPIRGVKTNEQVQKQLQDLTLNQKAINQAIGGIGSKVKKQLKPRANIKNQIQVQKNLDISSTAIRVGAFTGLGLYERTQEVSAIRPIDLISQSTPSKDRYQDIVREINRAIPKEVTREITKILPRSIPRLLPRQVPRETTRLIPRLLPRIIPKQIPKSKVLLLPRSMRITKFKKIILPRVKPIKPFNIEKELKGITVFGRRRGKDRIVASGLTPQQAKKVAEDFADLTLARSVRFEGVGKEKIKLSTFRFRLPKPKSILPFGTFVERSKFALSTGGERREIQRARKKIR